MNIKDPIQNKMFRTFLKKVEYFFKDKRKEIQQQILAPNFEQIHNQYVKPIFYFLQRYGIQEISFREYDKIIEERTNLSYIKDPIKYTKAIIENNAFAEKLYCDIIVSIDEMIDSIEFQDYRLHSLPLEQRLKIIRSFQKPFRSPTQIKLSKYNFKRR